MYRFAMLMIMMGLPLVTLSSPNQTVSSEAINKGLSVQPLQGQGRIVAPQLGHQPNAGKPDIIVKDIVGLIQRGNETGAFLENIYVNEPLEVDIRLENKFAEYGYTRNKFKVKVQFKYGYSGPVVKEKVVMIRKDMEPGEILTKRVVFGRVKSTPGVIFIKVIADSTNKVNEAVENNNSKEISYRIEQPH